LQHPFSKRDPVKSRLSEDVFKKCVKQENGKLVDWLYAKQQSAQSMLKILGYK
jgi:hypothetical protein